MNFKKYALLVDYLTHRVCAIVNGHNNNAVLNALANVVGNCVVEVAEDFEPKIPGTLEERRERVVNIVIDTARQVIAKRDAKEAEKRAENERA